LKRLSELQTAAIDYSQTNLFQFAPAMSYPPDAWVKADPDFWKRKGPSHAKPAEKPAKTE
jgi:hypothetical protein